MEITVNDIYKVFLLLFFSSCIHNEDPPAVKYEEDLFESKIPSEDLATQDTIVLNAIKVISLNKGNHPLTLLTLAGDTIIKEADYYHRFHFLDIDEDGFKDIRVSIFSNTPNHSENYFFDAKSKTFRQILNSDLDIVKLKGTELFYSYNRTGCSDNNWESHLSKIIDWVEVPVGRIKGIGCGEKDDGIYIYKIGKEKEKLVQEFGIGILKGNPKAKWNFISTYWANNYKLF